MDIFVRIKWLNNQKKHKTHGFSLGSKKKPRVYHNSTYPALKKSPARDHKNGPFSGSTTLLGDAMAAWGASFGGFRNQAFCGDIYGYLTLLGI